MTFPPPSNTSPKPVLLVAEDGVGGFASAGSAAAPLAVTAPVTAPLPTAFADFATSATFARTNDTNGYIAKDVIADATSSPTIMTFSGMALAVGGGGTITKARAMTDNKANTARLRLHLFTVTTVSMPGDNAPYLLLYANVAKRIGFIDFYALATEDSTHSTAANSLRDDLSLKYKCDAADTKLYGIVETLDAFTPVASSNFRFDLEGYLAAV